MTCDLQHVLKLEVPIIVQVADRMMPLSEVIAWVPGAIIELTKTVGDELEMLATNKPIGLGTAVKIGENFGIQISYVGDLRSRIQAIGGPLVSDEDAPADDEEEDAAARADALLAGQV
ncbi:MAG: FliM/FliN family flagellar motor switch protein [Phycisphaerales bacterium]|nr:FliM/FliN family flagellar motor switch protein [Phycisphaerales bacterium]